MSDRRTLTVLGSTRKIIKYLEARILSSPSQMHDAEAATPASTVEPAPDWLVNFRRSPFPTGSYVSGPGFGVVFTDRGSDVLMVSWDNLSSANEDTMDRTPWGYAFVAKNGWSQLGIMTFSGDWFRNDALIAHLTSLRDSGFFSRFRKVVMTGTSMGGYAATAFASLAPGCTVVAFSPQSTLKQDLVPWETRFASGRRADWSGGFADGAVESQAAGQVFLIFDPRFEPDKRQTDRYLGDNVTRLTARYAGHKAALFLRRAGLLSAVVKAAVADALTPTEFYRIYRGGRRLPWYGHAVLARLIDGGHQRHVPRFAKAMQGRGAEALARSALARLAGAPAEGLPDLDAPARPPVQAAAAPRRLVPAPAAPPAARPAGSKPMGPHQRRLAARAAAAAAAAQASASTSRDEPSDAAALAPTPDLYQMEQGLPPLRPTGPLMWQEVQASRRGMGFLPPVPASDQADKPLG